MPAGRRAGGSRPDALVDSSVAIPLVLLDHEHHDAIARGVRGRALGLAGHAAFESFSVLTRLPAPARRTPHVVERLLRASFPSTRFLGARETETLFRRLAELGISGGSVFDALVGAVAVAHDAPLVTRDTRALEVYRALGVDLEVIV